MCDEQKKKITIKKTNFSKDGITYDISSKQNQVKTSNIVPPVKPSEPKPEK